MPATHSKEDAIQSIKDLIFEALSLSGSKVKSNDALNLFFSHLDNGHYEAAKQQLKFFRMGNRCGNCEYNQKMKQVNNKVQELISIGG